MSSNSSLPNSCWAVPARPSPELLAALKAGPFAGKSAPTGCGCTPFV